MVFKFSVASLIFKEVNKTATLRVRTEMSNKWGNKQGSRQLFLVEILY
jgi:hypothetical protein